MTASTSVLAVVISAAVSLVVVVVTQLWTSRRERNIQAYERRRYALIEVQDSALELRNALSRFGPLARRASGGAPSLELGAAQQRVDDAFARLDVRLTRMDDVRLTELVRAWRGLARFHYVSQEEVTTAAEAAAWQAMNDAFGVALTSATAATPVTPAEPATQLAASE